MLEMGEDESAVQVVGTRNATRKWSSRDRH